MTREAWLNALAQQLRPLFIEACHPLPERFRISCGWPSSRGLASPTAKSRTIGQCWPTEFSADGTPEVFVSPVLAEPGAVAAVLVHELIHVVLNCEHGHKGPFRKIATRVGLKGKMTATEPSEALAERLNVITARLGDYPHATLDRSKVAKQGTRMLKLECPDCGYTVRTTAKWLAAGLPTCPCGTEMIDPNQPDEEGEDE